MEKIKKHSLSIGISLSLILIFSFFINLLNYYDLLSANLYKISLVLLVALSIFLSAFILGKNTKEKGYLEGIKFGILIVLIMSIISYLAFDNNITIKSIIYYLILLITSATGSAFGINNKKEKN